MIAKILILFAAVSLVACNSYKSKIQPRGEEPVTPASIDYAFVDAKVFEPHCVRCHSAAGGDKGDVNMETYENVIANLAGIETTALEEMSMPPKRAGGPLGAYEQGILKMWLDAGAPRDAHTPPSFVWSLFGFASAEAAVLQTTKAHVEFLAIGKPSAIKIRGKGDDLKSDLQWTEGQLSGKFIFNLDSFNTGIELRDSHMKEKYLETGKFKNAELTLKPIALSQDPCKEDLKLEKVPFEATLKLHGVEKPVKGDFDVNSQKGVGQSQVRFQLNNSDFAIEIPVYLGIKVADQVDNTVELNWTCK